MSNIEQIASCYYSHMTIIYCQKQYLISTKCVSKLYLSVIEEKPSFKQYDIRLIDVLSKTSISVFHSILY